MSFFKFLLSHSLFVKVQGNEVLLTWLLVTLNNILLKYNFKNFLSYDDFLNYLFLLLWILLLIYIKKNVINL